MIFNLHESWKPVFPTLFQKEMTIFLNEILPNISYQPRKEDIFNVFQKPVNDIKVVILGPEPYSNPINTGFAFGIQKDKSITKELKIIQDEILFSNGVESFLEGTGEAWKTLEHWTNQGIFLLNTSLTVETGNPNSHDLYWENFMKNVINYISIKSPCIWLIWGDKNQKFIPYIFNSFSVENYDDEIITMIPSNGDWNYILKTSLPNSKFVGCKHFLYVNEILKVLKKEKINW